jgi:hypothetical protein
MWKPETGTLIFVGSVTAAMHFIKDKLPFILEHVSPQVKLNMQLQDGAPPQFN